MNKDMKNFTHDELVEKDNAEQGDEHDNSGKIVNALGFWIIWFVLFEFQCTNKEIGFGKHDEKEDNSDSSKEENSKGPSQTDVSFTMNIRLINVFPDDFIGFRSFFEFELDLTG